MVNQISILIADDHPIVRQGYISMFLNEKSIRIIGEAENGNEAISFVNQKAPDIILMDIEMPEMNGIAAAKIIKQKHPKIKFIFFSMHFQYYFYEEFLKLGFNGFLPKECDFTVLMNAINMSMETGSSFCLTRELLNKKRCSVNSNLEDIYKLSPREIEVLDLTCSGASTKAISLELNIAERTVEFHKTNLYNKANFKSLADMISYGIKLGLGRNRAKH